MPFHYLSTGDRNSALPFLANLSRWLCMPANLRRADWQKHVLRRTFVIISRPLTQAFAEEVAELGAGRFVRYRDFAIGIGGDIRLVGYHHDGNAMLSIQRFRERRAARISCEV